MKRKADAELNELIENLEDVEEDEVVEFEEDQLPYGLFQHIFSALSTVRLSSLYNMATDKTKAWVAAMCVLALWDQSEQVDWMVNMDKEQQNLIYSLWMGMPREMHDLHLNLAKDMPFGGKYLQLVKKYKNQGWTQSDEIQQYMKYMQRHKMNWAEALVRTAIKSCLDKGEWSRDVVELERLSGVFDENMLRTVGAQLLVHLKDAPQPPKQQKGGNPKEEKEEEKKVIELTDDTFHKTKKGKWMVDFYAPWCGWCKKLEPIWNDLANENDDEGVMIAKLDATQHKGTAVKFGIRGFPTIKMFKDGKVIDYQGERTVPAFKKFIELN